MSSVQFIMSPALCSLTPSLLFHAYLHCPVLREFSPSIYVWGLFSCIQNRLVYRFGRLFGAEGLLQVGFKGRWFAGSGGLGQRSEGGHSGCRRPVFLLSDGPRGKCLQSQPCLTALSTHSHQAWEALILHNFWLLLLHLEWALPVRESQLFSISGATVGSPTCTSGGTQLLLPCSQQVQTGDGYRQVPIITSVILPVIHSFIE